MSKCKQSGKIRYKAELDAKIGLALASSKHNGLNTKTEVRYYKCPDCKGWHLTSRK